MSFSSTDESPQLSQPDRFPGDPASAEVDQPVTGGLSSLRCEVCSAVVATEQRYCVECGNHRLGVPDPAASFMNRSVGPSSPRAGRAVVISSPRGRLLTALALVMIPIAIGVGVLIGRASNNADARLLRGLSQERSRVVTVHSGAAQIVTVAAGGTGVSRGRKTSPKRIRTRTAAAPSHTAGASVGSSSSAGQAKQSAKIVKKLQSTNGLSYLDPLPSQVGG